MNTNVAVRNGLDITLELRRRRCARSTHLNSLGASQPRHEPTIDGPGQLRMPHFIRRDAAHGGAHAELRGSLGLAQRDQRAPTAGHRVRAYAGSSTTKRAPQPRPALSAVTVPP